MEAEGGKKELVGDEYDTFSVLYGRWAQLGGSNSMVEEGGKVFS